MFSSDRLQRHDFVWLDPQIDASQLLPCSPDARRLLADWIASQRPLIVARRLPGTPLGWSDLGLPLPPDQGKRRLGFKVGDAAIIRARQAPKLADIADSAPPPWKNALTLLDLDARAAGIRFRVYGSFAWQRLTRLTYISATSDVDLLWKPKDQSELESGIELLQQWERSTGLTADGEIQLPSGQSACWREYAASPPQVLVKSRDHVGLIPFSQVKQQFMALATAC